MLSNFICDALPGAKRTCEYLKEAEYEHPSERSTTKFYLDLDALLRIVFFGVSKEERQQLYHKELRDRVKARYLSMYGDADNSTIPRTCLSEEDRSVLLQESLDMEEHLRPYLHWNNDSTAEERERDHREGFARAVEKGKYCSLDLEKVMKEKEWTSFFKQLKVPIVHSGDKE